MIQDNVQRMAEDFTALEWNNQHKHIQFFSRFEARKDLYAWFFSNTSSYAATAKLDNLINLDWTKLISILLYLSEISNTVLLTL